MNKLFSGAESSPYDPGTEPILSLYDSSNSLMIYESETSSLLSSSIFFESFARNSYGSTAIF